MGTRTDALVLCHLENRTLMYDYRTYCTNGDSGTLLSTYRVPYVPQYCTVLDSGGISLFLFLCTFPILYPMKQKVIGDQLRLILPISGGHSSNLLYASFVSVYSMRVMTD